MPNYNKKKLHAVTKNDARPECIAFDEENKGKRKKVAAVTVFQREFRKNNTQFSEFAMSHMALINAAREAYNDLPVSEKQKYEKIASEENRQLVATEGHNWQKDQFGRQRSNLIKESERYKKWDSVDAVEHMKLLLNGTREEIVKRSFVVVRVSFYLGEPGHKRPGVDLIVPAEITLVRYSINLGVEDSMTLFPVAANVPAFLQSAGVESEEIHGLNMLDNGAVDKLTPGEMVVKIRNFMAAAYTPDMRPPPLFALGRQYLDAIPMGLKHIYDAAGAECPFLLSNSNYGYCYMLEDFTELIHKRGKQLQNDSIEIGLDRLDPNKLVCMNYKEAPTNLRIQKCCEVHMMLNRTEVCTQTSAFCHVWWSLFTCMGFYKVVATKDHFPLMLLDLWDSDQSTNTSSSENTPVPTPPRPKAGRGRGVTVAEPSAYPRPGMMHGARGRGRSLRGRLPTNID